MLAHTCDARAGGMWADSPPRFECLQGYTTNSSSTSFLWSATTNIKCDNKGSYITYNGVSYGPTFGGGHDLYIGSNALSSTGSYTNPSSYSCGSNTALSGQYSGYTLTDYEVCGRLIAAVPFLFLLKVISVATFLSLTVCRCG